MHQPRRRIGCHRWIVDDVFPGIVREPGLGGPPIGWRDSYWLRCGACGRRITATTQAPYPGTWFPLPYLEASGGLLT